MNGVHLADPAAGVVIAHGVGSREDLPLPLTYAIAGAVVALLVSFVALGVLWRTPRLTSADGPALPDAVIRVADATVTRALLRALGVLVFAWVVMAAVFGRDDALNPTAGAVYVLLWIGVPLASVLLGPVWRLLNPLRTLHIGLSRALGTRPEDGLAGLPRRLGVWPAAGALLAFVWLELVAPGNTTLPVLRLFLAGYVSIQLVAATYFGSGWFAVGDGFESFSDLLGRCAPIGRRTDRRLGWRNPLASLATTPPIPGLFAVVGVLLGSTAFDSLSNSPWWVTRLQESPLSQTVTGTLGLLATVALVTGAFAAAAAVSGRGGGVPTPQVAAAFAPTLVPIIVGYFVAHYWSLLIAIGQQTLIQMSDPLGTGANWLGLSDRGIDFTLIDPTFVALLQVTAIVAGHVLGVVLAHEKALQLFPARQAVTGQLPMLALMVGYTVGGLTLLFAA